MLKRLQFGRGAEEPPPDAKKRHNEERKAAEADASKKGKETMAADAEQDADVKYDYLFTWLRVQTALRNMDSSRGGAAKVDVASVAPPPRSGHAAFTVGASDSKIFVHGGAAGGEYYKDLWALDTTTKKWQNIHTFNSPAARAYHQIAIVAPEPGSIEKGKASPRLLMFGGFMEGTLFSEVEVLQDFSVITKGLPKATFGTGKKKKPEQAPEGVTTDVWQRIVTGGEPPMPRCNHTLTVVGGKMVVLIGGWHGNFTNDVYTLDVSTWTWKYRRTTLHPDIKHAEFSPRAGHCSVLLPSRRILVFGGQNSKQGQLGDLWVLDTVSWEWMKPLPVGTPPTKRSGHAAVFNRQGHVYFFGGWDGVRMRSDLGVLSCSGDPQMHWKWKKPSVSGADIPPRVSASLSFVGSRLWVYGGWGPEGFLDDTHALEVSKKPRDMVKDKYLKAKLKTGLARMGAAAEKAAFDRAAARGVNPLAMMDPRKMTLRQIEDYHQDVHGKMEEAAQYLRAKDQEIHFLKDRQDRQKKKVVATQAAHDHQLRYKKFLEQGATMEEATALASGFANPELKARFGMDGYRTIPEPPEDMRRQDMTQEQINSRIYGRSVYLGDGADAGDDPVDAISRSGGLITTWGLVEAPREEFFPDDLFNTQEASGSRGRWEIGNPDEDYEDSESGSYYSQSQYYGESGRHPEVPMLGGDGSMELAKLAITDTKGSDASSDNEDGFYKVPKYTGELALERAGDENLHGINPDMGPVLREIIREQVRVKPLKRGQLKVPAPAKNPMRPTRIVEGLNVPQDLEDIIDPSRLKLQTTDQQLQPAPYDPAAVRVPQDLLDVAIQSKGGKYRSTSSAMALIAKQAEDMSLSAADGNLPHSLLLLAATRGVDFDRTVRAARGEPLPIPGVSYGSDPSRPVPDALQKIANGMQKVAKGWMQKREYKRTKACQKIQALVRGRAARKEVAKMREEMGLRPFRPKYVKRAVANKHRYETKRTKDQRQAYKRRVGGVASAIEYLPDGPSSSTVTK